MKHVLGRCDRRDPELARAPARRNVSLTAQPADPFQKLFFSRIPKDVAESFSPAQLDAVKLAFGARSSGAHAVDLRFTVPIAGRSWYVVLLAGRVRRMRKHLHYRGMLKRLMRRMWRTGNALIATLMVLLGMFALLIVLYVGKRALGIDIFPGFDMLPDRQIERSLR